MSDFTARLGMLRGSMPPVASGGSRGVRLRLGEMHELIECRQQAERLAATSAATDGVQGPASSRPGAEQAL